MENAAISCDLLLVVNDEASRAAAVGDLLVYRPIGMTGLLAFTRTEFSCSPSEIKDF